MTLKTTVSFQTIVLLNGNGFYQGALTSVQVAVDW